MGTGQREAGLDETGVEELKAFEAVEAPTRLGEFGGFVEFFLRAAPGCGAAPNVGGGRWDGVAIADEVAFPLAKQTARNLTAKLIDREMEGNYAVFKLRAVSCRGL